MTGFRFPLEKALAWRRAQLELAQADLGRQLAVLAEIDRMRRELESAGRQSEIEVRAFRPLAGADLGALDRFRLHVKVRAVDLSNQRVECQKEVAKRQAVLLEARRQCRLLERLREKRFAEWQLTSDRELEQLAGDSYLALWARR